MTTLCTGIRILIATLPVTLLFASRPLEAQTTPKPATEATKAANRALQQYLNFNDREDFDNATRGFIGKPDSADHQGCQGQRRLGSGEVQGLHQHGQAGTRHGQPEPVAQRPAQHAVRPLQGARPHLPGARVRPVQHHLRPGRHRLDRVRSADLGGDRKGGVRAGDAASRHSGRSSPWSTAIRTSITTAACAASSTKPTSRPARSRSSRLNTSPSTPSARTSSPATP